MPQIEATAIQAEEKSPSNASGYFRGDPEALVGHNFFTEPPVYRLPANYTAEEISSQLNEINGKIDRVDSKLNSAL